jgi:hypothetical protein
MTHNEIQILARRQPVTGSFTLAQYSKIGCPSRLGLAIGESKSELALPIPNHRAWTTMSVRAGESLPALPAELLGPVVGYEEHLFEANHDGASIALLVDGEWIPQRLPVPAGTKKLAVRVHRQECAMILGRRTPWDASVTVDVHCDPTPEQSPSLRGDSVLFASGNGAFIVNHTQLMIHFAGQQLLAPCSAGVQTTSGFNDALRAGWLIPCFGLRGGMHRVAWLETEPIQVPIGERLRELGAFAWRSEDGDRVGVVGQSWLLEPLGPTRAPEAELQPPTNGRYEVVIGVSGAEGMPALFATILLTRAGNSDKVSEPQYVGDPFVEYSGAALDAPYSIASRER